MSGIIQLLPDHVANQIAAGEVVQRPASVVKELLENAVDAGATEIRLVVKDAGKTLIQVIDNGIGMGQEDALACFQRHATSKIRKAEDLFDLHTKGFRGEALASIAAIAHVELRTRRSDDELGIKLQVEGGKFGELQQDVLPEGTSFSVKNLFFNIPARRNFLKSDTVELRHVLDEFQRVAFTHPEIAFYMHHNNSEVYHLPESNLRQRIVGIMGGRTNEKLVPIQEDTAIAGIRGFIGKPEFSKKSRGEQFFFVNDRFIRNGYLHHAVMAAYEGLLKEGFQPSYFIYLEVPAASIDINIHPTKTEVKFDDEQSLYAILRSAVKHSLGQFSVSASLDFERQPELDTPYDYHRKTSESPGIEVDEAFNPFASAGNMSLSPSATSSAPKTRTSSYLPKTETASWESLYVGLAQEEPSEPIASAMEFESEVKPLSLFEEKNTVSKTYQLHRKYIVNPIKSGMVIVDQQRAHQRVLYEQFLAGMTVHQASSQQLLFPLQLFFQPVEMACLEEMLPSLQSAGFGFSGFESDHVIIEGIPVSMTESETPIVLESLIADMGEGFGNSFSQNDRIAQSMAKSVAVKTGTLLSETEQQELVNALFACKEPMVSPFGKPTCITLSVEDIDKKFAL